jgi:hypothetical protein
MSEHTPGPWTVEDATVFGPICDRICTVDVGDDDDEPTLTGQGEQPHGQGRANAAFIVLACNAHDDLLEALQTLIAHQGAFGAIINAWSRDPGGREKAMALFDQCRAAVAKATA